MNLFFANANLSTITFLKFVRAKQTKTNLLTRDNFLYGSSFLNILKLLLSPITRSLRFDVTHLSLSISTGSNWDLSFSMVGVLTNTFSFSNGSWTINSRSVIMLSPEENMELPKSLESSIICLSLTDPP